MKKPSSPSCFVVNLDPSLNDKLQQLVTREGFSLTQPPHTVFAAKKKGISCILYLSGKLVVQGKDMAPFIEYCLEPEILGEFVFSYRDVHLDRTPRIGVDEAGKGDFFGPLCVAAVFAEGDMVVKLQEMGVRDSKKISDSKIIAMSKKIRSLCKGHVISMSPLKYNELYNKFHNLNRLLAWGHATAIEQVVKLAGCDNVIVDQFAAKEVLETALARKNVAVALHQRPRAEEDIVVAAASIVARAAFLEGMELLAKQVGRKLLKGAGQQVRELGKVLAIKHGPEMLQHVAKIHFKTYNEILAEL